MKKIKKINTDSTRFPYNRHYKKTKIWEKMASSSYKIIISQLILELTKKLRAERLIKSKGWSGDANIIKVPIFGNINKVIDKHLNALKWVLLGKNAGADAIKSAKLTGIYNKITPGVLISTYLDSIDTDMEFFKSIYGYDVKGIPSQLANTTIDYITQSAQRYMEQLIPEIKNSLLYAIENIQESLNYKNLASMIEDNQGREFATKTVLRKELQNASKKGFNKWNFGVKTEMGKSSAIGSHQAMVEIFGKEDDSMRVIWLMVESEKNCKFCINASKNPDGSFKYYKLSDFKPVGYNYSKKQKDWELTIPPVHPHCACRLVYVPPGFTVTKDGTIIPKNN